MAFRSRSPRFSSGLENRCYLLSTNRLSPHLIFPPILLYAHILGKCPSEPKPEDIFSLEEFWLDLFLRRHKLPTRQKILEITYANLLTVLVTKIHLSSGHPSCICDPLSALLPFSFSVGMAAHNIDHHFLLNSFQITAQLSPWHRI